MAAWSCIRIANRFMAAIASLSLLVANAATHAETQVQTFDTSWTVSPWNYYGEVAALAWSYTPYTVWNTTLGTLEKVEVSTVVSGSRSKPSDTLTVGYSFFTGGSDYVDDQFGSGVSFASGSSTFAWRETRSFTGSSLVDWLTYDYLPTGATQGAYYIETNALTSTYTIVAQTRLTYEYTPALGPFTVDVATGLKTQGCSGISVA